MTIKLSAFVLTEKSGVMSLGWAFTLEKVNNKWLIDDFRNDAQEMTIKD